MSLATSQNLWQYAGNGVATAFPYTALVLDETHFVVTVTDSSGVDTPLTLNVDYAVSGVGNESGGDITYPVSGSPLASGSHITIRRVVPVTQPLVLASQGAWSPSVIEQEFDLLVMMAQQLSEQLGRMFDVPDTTESLPDLTVSPEANAVLGWSSDGTKLENKLAAYVANLLVSTWMFGLLSLSTLAEVWQYLGIDVLSQSTADEIAAANDIAAVLWNPVITELSWTTQAAAAFGTTDDAGFTGQVWQDASGPAEITAAIPASGSYEILLEGALRAKETTNGTGWSFLTTRIYYDVDTGSGYSGTWTEIANARTVHDRVPSATAFSDCMDAAVKARLTGLTNGATYKFRATGKASNASSTFAAQGDAPTFLRTTVVRTDGLGAPLPTSPYTAPPTFSAFTLTAPFAADTTDADLGYRLNPLTGRVELRGVFDTGGVGVSPADFIVESANALPATCRPPKKTTLLVGLEVIAVQTDGTITYEGPGGVPGSFVLNDISYPVTA